VLLLLPCQKDFPLQHQKGQIEVKQYPAYRSATVRYSGELSMAANRAFDPLYRHISSNNISMTAPVETRYPVSTLEASEMAHPMNAVKRLFHSSTAALTSTLLRLHKTFR
jgi:hypothetical protein